MLSCLLSSVFICVRKNLRIVQPGSSQAPVTYTSYLPLGISIQFLTPFNSDVCIQAVSPDLFAHLYWHYCSPRHGHCDLASPLSHLVSPLSFQSAASPVDSSLRSFRLLCLHLISRPSSALALLH